MSKAYYARSIHLYGKEQEARDKSLIESLGFEVVDVNKAELQNAYSMQGMAAFKPYVDSVTALFFRAYMDGSIGAGVAKEIEWAQGSGIAVVELPHSISTRILTVEQTREYLKEVGFR